MRRSLTWLLGAVLVLTAVVLWLPERASMLVQAVETRRAAANEAVPTGALLPLPPLPLELARTTVEPATRDPFAEKAAVIMPIAPPSPAPVVALPPAPVAATVPPLQWRLMGTMAAPDGQWLVVLTHSNEQQTAVATPGLQLEGGYEVTAVTAEAVRLTHPPTQTEVVIPIPPPAEPSR